MVIVIFVYGCLILPVDGRKMARSEINSCDGGAGASGKYHRV